MAGAGDQYTNTTGRKRLFRDSKIGNILNGAAVVAVLYIADAAGNLDLSPLPDVIEPLAVGIVGTVVGTLVSWATARRKPGSPAA